MTKTSFVEARVLVSHCDSRAREGTRDGEPECYSRQAEFLFVWGVVCKGIIRSRRRFKIVTASGTG